MVRHKKEEEPAAATTDAAAPATDAAAAAPAAATDAAAPAAAAEAPAAAPAAPAAAAAVALQASMAMPVIPLPDVDLLAAAAAAVQKQVEFYFSDSNLPKDKFLRGKVQADPQGFVDLALLCTFSRMREHQAALGAEEFVGGCSKTLKASATLVLSEDGRRVRRSAALPDRDTSLARTVYAAGLGETEPQLDEMTALFSAHGTIRSVRFHREGASDARVFKGGCFVELETIDQATALLAAEVAYKEAKLALRPKAEWVDELKAARREKEAAKAAEPPPPLVVKKVAGAVISVKGMGATASREEIKEKLLVEGATIYFMLYNRGEPDGYVLFNEEGAAALVLTKFSAEGAAAPELGGAVPTLGTVEGEEAEAQWIAVAQKKAASEAHKAAGGSRRGGGGRGGGRGRGRGGRGGGFKRRNSRGGSPGGDRDSHSKKPRSD